MTLRAALLWPLWGSAALPLAASAQAVAGSSAPPNCVDVRINQHAVLGFDCLSRRLAPSPPEPAPRVPDAADIATEPSNRQAGQYNFSAFSHRMGNQLGKSVVPQRPPPAPPRPLVVPSPAH